MKHGVTRGVIIAGIILVLGVGVFRVPLEAQVSVEPHSLGALVIQLRLELIGIHERAPFFTPPSPFAVSFDQCGQATIEWGSGRDADRYELYRNGSLVFSGERTWFVDTGLIQGRTYEYIVRAVNRAGASSFTEGFVVTARDRCPPVTPAPFSVEARPCGGNVTIEWREAPRADVYRLSRGGTGFFGRSTVVYEGPGTEFLDTDRGFDQRYSYSLEAGNQSGWSEPQTVRGRSSDVCPPGQPGFMRAL